VRDLEVNIEEQQADPFDLDAITAADLEEPVRRAAPYDLGDLDRLLNTPALLPPGIEVSPLGPKEYRYLQPGMQGPVRATTSRESFEEHPLSRELWSPGGPLFPRLDVAAQPPAGLTLEDVLSRARGRL
jgi:hypothetical protein